ncbi:MIP family channel protein [Streptomyces sp. XD-27]|uniref:MIP family channel protein n=1 Tax=Streptomyces sp. XD-27 TaxID=3062779 RepID=UPI0026F43FBD|nr:MIP family channel protein [Streptomyces sp. XD-27]WKX73362.1 MIP family channel protein [Streptomyces sp. XD-27]
METRTDVIETRTVVAEFVGTLLLVFFAVGSAVVGARYIGTTGIALAFGFTLLALTYALGRVSGSHLNPAVTLGVLLARRIELRTAIEYWLAQLLGAIAGAALLLLLAKQVPDLEISGAFGSNGYGDRSAVGMEAGGAFLAEVMLTLLLVYVYLSVTRTVSVGGLEPLPIGLTLAVVTLVGVPLTGASVNPARSLGPGMFAGGDAMEQYWLFLIAPLVGGALAAVVHRFTHADLAAERIAPGTTGPAAPTGPDTAAGPDTSPGRDKGAE